MSSLPQTSEQKIPAPARRNTVVMGRQGFLSMLIRLIGVELYKIRRRMMSKVLSTILLFIMLATFGVLSISPIVTFFSAPENSLSPQIEHQILQRSTAALLLPNSFSIAVETARFIGLFLIIILAGTIIGGEYSVGTIRLMLTRGPTRTQFLLAKVGAILICIVLSMLVVVPVGILAGALLAMPLGFGANVSLLTGGWILHALLYMLVAILGLFVYAMIAVCLSTLGRATAAGVAGALVWWVLEAPLGAILSFLGSSSVNRGPLADFLEAIPNYFIGNNISALLQNQLYYMSANSDPGTLSDVHALLVLAAYIVLFIGLAWWINGRRDITN